MWTWLAGPRDQNEEGIKLCEEYLQSQGYAIDSETVVESWRVRIPLKAEIQLVFRRHVAKAMEYINIHHLTGPRSK